MQQNQGLYNFNNFREVAGSNPVAPTIINAIKSRVSEFWKRRTILT